MKFDEYCIKLNLTDEERLAKFDAIRNGPEKEKYVNTLGFTSEIKNHGMSKDDVVRFYDESSQLFESSSGNENKELKAMYNSIEEKLKEMSSKNRPKILDMGCGQGFTTCLLAINNPQYDFTGIDISDEMLKKSFEKKDKFGIKNVKFSNMDYRYMDFPDNHFDMICNLRPDWPDGEFGFDEMMLESYRVLKSGKSIMTIIAYDKNHYKTEYGKVTPRKIETKLLGPGEYSKQTIQPIWFDKKNDRLLALQERIKA